MTGARTTFAAKAHPHLAPAVEQALRSSNFGKACAGKSVTLVFNFVIDEKLDPGAAVRISFSYPNQFSIMVPHPVAHID